MTTTDPAPPEQEQREGDRPLLARIIENVTGFWVVRRVMAVMEAANAAGAPLLAAALAFVTMFAMFPGLLLLAGVLGWVVDDPATRAELLAQLVALIPPLEEALAGSLERAVDARGALSLVGVLGLIWGASNFYQSLDEVMRRLFPGGEIRGFLQRRIRGIVAILVLVALVVGTVLLGGLWALLDDVLGEVGDLFLLQLVPPFISLLVMVLVVVLVYRFVPTDPPSIRAALPPAIAAGTGIALLTNLFTVLAPWLVGGLAAFGILAAIFGAFVWLNFSFQMLLYGAAWARYRRDRERLTRESV